MRAPLLRSTLVLVTTAAVLAGCTSSSSSSSSSGAAPAGALHAPHLQGGAISAGMSCNDCHAPSGFGVDFSQNPAVVAAGATYDPVTKTCSNVACHGNFDLNGVKGSFATVSWTNQAPLGCTSCHGMPPTGHPAIAGNGDAPSCSGCHADTVKPDGTINLATTAHVNLKTDMSGGTCSSCHGDPSRASTVLGTDPDLTSAPPLAPAGFPAAVVGAHLVHLNPSPTGIVAASPVACSECHVVPGDATHATTPPAQKVVFGALATAGGAAPTYVAGTLGCAATYCHGSFSWNGVSGSNAAPLWTDVGALDCTSCHGMPPTGHPPVVGTPTAAACSACHTTSIDATGAVIPSGAHLDGKPDVANLGCTDCHGDPTRVGTLAGTDVNLVSAPPVATATALPSVVGAHLGHVNPSQATALSGPVACKECHVVPTDLAHSKNPPSQAVVFGPLAKTGGAVPTYTLATTGCAATYCHGNFAFNGVTGSNAAPVWTDTAAMTCTSCHGMPPVGHPALAATPTAASCATCHPKSVNADGTINLVDRGHLNGLPDTSAVGCSSCHGDATRKGNLAGVDQNLASAPPVAPPGAPGYAVGAHVGHLNPTTASFLMAPIACAECHVVPADSAHATAPPAQKVVFGALSRTGGAAPVWTTTTAGCAATYCHGNFTFNGVSGSKATPIWTSATPMTCTSCHGMPPTGHIATASTTAASCAQCHPAAVNADGTINAAGGGHLNGKADVTALACTSCHGDATRKGNLAGTDANLASAPPIAQTGAPSYAVGAHLGHMNPTTASYLMAPVACKECHVVPTDSGHATNPPANVVVFGTLSKTGGAAPAWSTATAGCSATYCHGNFAFNGVTGSNAAPVWTSTSPMTCTSCHAMPPTGHPAFTGTPTAASCFQCHPQSVNSDGSIKQGGGHINGKADGGGCTSCHGDPPSTGKHTISDHRNRRCDACHPTGYTSTTAIAPFHQNNVVDIGAQAGYSCGLKGCAPGVARTCTNNCHGKETW